MEALFQRFDSFGAKDQQRKRVLQEIDRLDENRLLNTKPEELTQYFVERFKMDVPVLHEDKVTGDVQDVQVDARRHRDRFHFIDNDGPIPVDGTRITFFVPFEGDPEFFHCHPSSYTMNPPRADIGDGELQFTFDTIEHNQEAVKGQYQQSLGQVRQWLENVRRDMKEFNDALPGFVSGRLQQRRDKILRDKNMGAALGVPLRRREGAPQTFAAPITRRRIPTMPPTQPGAGVPEPTLDQGEYEHILSVMKGMAKVLERSPDAFRGMDEEAIRQHFLVQLNGQYEGQATGETFNAAGKTDILVRSGDRNIFIAECKFWKGPESFSGALNQLLGYTTWRDSKTALVIFNRDRNLTTVLGKIPDLMKAHSGFVRVIFEKPTETEFRYAFRRADDPERELTITVLVFEIGAVPDLVEIAA